MPWPRHPSGRGHSGIAAATRRHSGDGVAQERSPAAGRQRGLGAAGLRAGVRHQDDRLAADLPAGAGRPDQRVHCSQVLGLADEALRRVNGLLESHNALLVIKPHPLAVAEDARAQSCAVCHRWLAARGRADSPRTAGRIVRLGHRRFERVRRLPGPRPAGGALLPGHGGLRPVAWLLDRLRSRTTWPVPSPRTRVSWSRP